MTFARLRYLCRSDLHRYGRGTGPGAWIATAWRDPGFLCTWWARVHGYFAQARPRAVMKPCSMVAGLFERHCSIRHGIDLPAATTIGPGLYIPHTGGINVNARSVIGANCNLSQGVTLGVSNRGARAGTPVIGDDVYIGPGAKIIGRVVLGDRAAVGANCVVTKDVPDDAVVVGVPGRVISSEGSAGYINCTDYPPPTGAELPPSA